MSFCRESGKSASTRQTPQGRSMRAARILVGWTLVAVLTSSPFPISAAEIEEQDPAYYHTGELAGSLRTDEPPPFFDADPQHLWNRIFAAATIRPSRLPSRRDGPPVARIEGGDRIEFLRLGRHHVLGRAGECRAARAAAGSVPRTESGTTLDGSSQTGAAPARSVDLVRFSDGRPHRTPWRSRNPSPSR